MNQKDEAPSYGLSTVPKVGRPMKYETADALRDRIEDYFKSCFIKKTEKRWVTHEYYDEEGDLQKDRQCISVDVKGENGEPVLEQIQPFTVGGLAVHLGLSRQALLNYEKNEARPEYVDTVKSAKAIIEAYSERRLFGSSQVAGVIFSLKVNHGWNENPETPAGDNSKTNPELVKGKVQDMLSAPIAQPPLPAAPSAPQPEASPVTPEQPDHVDPVHQ